MVGKILNSLNMHWLAAAIVTSAHQAVLISSCFRNTVYNICGSKQLWGNNGNVFSFDEFQEHPENVDEEQEAEVESGCAGDCY